MKIKFLFSYVKNQFLPYTRKACLVRHHDGVLEVDIPEIHSKDAPIAIRATYESSSNEPFLFDFRWFNNQLWTSQEFLSGQTAINEMISKPKQFAMYMPTIDLRTNYQMCDILFGIYLENAENSKAEAITYLTQWARNELIIDGIRYRPSGEPYFEVSSSQHAKQRGSTTYSINTTRHQPNTAAYIYNLFEREQAIAKAIALASDHGNVKSQPIKPHGPNWEIFIPEAVQIKPIEERTRKFIGSIKTSKEGLTCELEYEFMISANATLEEIEKVARENILNQVTWSYRAA